MKAFWFVLLLSTLCVCCDPARVSSEDQPSAGTFQKARLWNNALPADGCDYRISLLIDTTWTEYGPDAPSRELIEKFATENLDFTSAYNGYKEVQIKGAINKSLVTVSCGWGATRQLPGISVSEIRK